MRVTQGAYAGERTIPFIATDLIASSSHSLVGLRGIALSRSASVESHSTPSALLLAASQHPSPHSHSTSPTLYTYPAQCNATGARLGLDFAKKIKRADPNGVVLVDAAAYCATKSLDLGSCTQEDAPDAVVGSFYKIFVSVEISLRLTSS